MLHLFTIFLWKTYKIISITSLWCVVSISSLLILLNHKYSIISFVTQCNIRYWQAGIYLLTLRICILTSCKTCVSQILHFHRIYFLWYLLMFYTHHGKLYLICIYNKHRYQAIFSRLLTWRYLIHPVHLWCRKIL